MKVRMNQEREEAGIPMRRIGSLIKAGTMTAGKVVLMGLTSMSMAIPIWISLRGIIRLRANAASGIRIAQPAINRLRETAVMFLPVRG
jgi:hypothetical protein